MKRRAIVELISILFVLLFIYASISKLIDFQNFKIQLSKSPYLTIFSGVLSLMVPILEIAIALLLLILPGRLIGLYASFFFMILFTGFIVAILRFSSYIPCSCGGILQKMSWTQHLIFNIGFLLLAVIAILLYPPQRSTN